MGKTKKAALIKGTDRKDNIHKCLELIKDDLDPLRSAKNILIKPNLVALKPDFANTHVDAVEAVSWITPVISSGRLSILRSHSITTSSSSAAAGDVFQIIHCAPIPAVRSSARMEGGLLLAEK